MSPRDTKRFFLLKPHLLPLGGLPAPKPCPFCADKEIINAPAIVIDESSIEHTTAHAECGGCGATAPWAVMSPAEEVHNKWDLYGAAAKNWNDRAT